MTLQFRKSGSHSGTPNIMRHDRIYSQTGPTILEIIQLRNVVGKSRQVVTGVHETTSKGVSGGGGGVG